MWHHFELTHSQQLAVQRGVTLSAEEWNYLQLSVIGAASAISLIVSTISQRWTNGDGLVGTYVPPHALWVSGKDWKQRAWELEKLLIPSLSWRTMIFGGQVAPRRAAHQASVFWQTHSDWVGFWKLRPCLHFNGDNLRGKLKKWVKAALLSGDCEKCLP